MVALLRVSVPFTALAASPSHVQVNADGQLFVITRTEINIFTPALGYQVDKEKRIATKKGKERARSDTPLFRTSFIVEKKDTLDWAAWSNDNRTAGAASGLNEPMWRAATWSPSALGALGGCVLATLSTHHEVIIFEPIKNAHQGSWPESFDLTSQLVRLLLPLEDGTVAPVEGIAQLRLDLHMKVLECQATSLSWSPEVPDTTSDFSLLVVGHKSGHISIWRRWAGQMEILHRYRLDDDASWISLLTWSPWLTNLDGEKKMATSILAVADCAGRVWTVELSQDVSRARTPRAEDEAETTSAKRPLKVAMEDGRAATQMCWAGADGDLPRLVYTKLGSVNEVRFVKERGTMRQYRVGSESSFDMPSTGAPEWEGTTPFAVCAGIHYEPASNSVLLALADASFYHFDLSPALALSTAAPTSYTLTRHARELYIAAHRTGPDAKLPSTRLGERIMGFAVLGGAERDLAWIAEDDDPNRISYLNNSLAKTSLVIDSRDDVDAELQLAYLAEALSSPWNSRSTSPLTHLRGTLHYITDFGRDDDFISGLLDLLPFASLDEESDVQMRDPEAGIAAQFVERLYGEAHVESLRMRETVCRFVVRHPHLNVQHTPRALALQSTLTRQLAHSLTTHLGFLLDQYKDLLNATETAILGRLLLASASLKSTVPSPSPDMFVVAFGSTEVCPACRAPIPFASVRRATCTNAHEWDRCSITLAVLSTVNVRTCVGCERKALLALDGGRPEDGRERLGVIDMVLKAATCCLYCGGRWMRIR